jgi:L-aspartate oxidase
MRYAFNDNIQISEKTRTDVLIVGAGIAGLYTALHIAPEKSVLVLSKESIQISNSYLAQGGIAAAIRPDDQAIFHVEDTLVAGAGLCDREAVEVLCAEGPDDIRTLVDLHVPFDLNAYGDLSVGREGGHHMNRIVHAGGDATGREAVKTLAAIAHERENITFMEHTCLVDVLLDGNGEVCGALLNNDGYILVSTANVVIATGGIGQIYEYSTNPAVATGDGLGAAIRCGAKLRDMEFIQFHPTGLYNKERENRSFLISEAVRGDGGKLINAKGERFMTGKHELGELAPRDIVARGIQAELRESGEDHVFIDITHKSREELGKRFPTIFGECLRRGIDISKNYIPVRPVQHYMMGGIATDLQGMTNITGLFACGEAARTGVHGANRLASNSMLECLVFGRRAAEHINRLDRKATAPAKLPEDLCHIPTEELGVDYEGLRLKLRYTMNENAYIVRTAAGLKKAQQEVAEILEILEKNYLEDRAYLELVNLCMVSQQILQAALARPHSVGAHYIVDETGEKL